MLETIVIGCGPYGLAVAAHLRARGVETRVFGEPMSFWRNHTPVGMRLRSSLCASDIGCPDDGFTLASYLDECEMLPEGPIPVDSFICYANSFQTRMVPDIDKRKVTAIVALDDGFSVTVDDGERFRTRRVVVATGIANFAYRPPVFHALAPELVSHSQDRLHLNAFKGRRVAIIGSGQSALENAALMSEAGAEVAVIMRAPQISWLRGAVSLRDRLGPLGRMIFPWTDVGSPPFNQLIAHPSLFRLLPAHWRVAIDRATMHASVAKWVRPRLTGVQLNTSRTIVSAERSGAQVKMVLDDGNSRLFDHVVLATGFRIDIARLSFLSREMLAGIKRPGGYPDLNAGFECSIRGLHFVGAPAAYSFGSLTRFVAGTRYCAATLANAMCSSTGKLAAPVSRPETVLN